MKYENSSATGYKGMKIPYTLYGKTDSAKDLMILLPGAAYTVKSPVFHYLSGLFFNRSTDILEVNYSYQDEFYEDFSSEEKVTAVKMDAHAVIDEILRTNSYENYSIIGKSIGTFAMSTLLNREVFKRSKVVWMTPILTEDEVFRTIASAHQEGFCVIGDEDRFYKKELLDELAISDNLRTRVLSGVNHNLDVSESPFKSIDMLKEIVSDIDGFLSKHH